MDNWDYTDFTGLLRAYSVYSKTQCMVGNFILHTLAQFDQARADAMKIRYKLRFLKRSASIYKNLKTLDKLGYSVRPKEKVTKRKSEPVTSEEIQALDKQLKYSETLEADQRSLIQTKFKNADVQYTLWSEDVKPIKGDMRFRWANEATKQKAQAARLHEKVEKQIGSILNEWFDIISLTNCDVSVVDGNSAFVVKQKGLIVGSVDVVETEEKSTEPQLPPGSYNYNNPHGWDRPIPHMRLATDTSELVESSVSVMMKERRTSKVEKVQESQPSEPEEEEKKSPTSASEEESQKNRPIQMTGIEDGQRKFEDFNRGGGTDYRQNIKEFQRDTRGDVLIT